MNYDLNIFKNAPGVIRCSVHFKTADKGTNNIAAYPYANIFFMAIFKLYTDTINYTISIKPVHSLKWVWQKIYVIVFDFILTHWNGIKGPIHRTSLENHYSRWTTHNLAGHQQQWHWSKNTKSFHRFIIWQKQDKFTGKPLVGALSNWNCDWHSVYSAYLH